LLSEAEIAQTSAVPWSWGSVAPGVRAVVTQTADPAWSSIDPAWFPKLAVVLDGRNSLRDLTLSDGVAYHGIGVPRQTGR
jgi:hypothetical protein